MSAKVALDARHVLGHGSLGDLEAEHPELTVDSGSAPQRILPRHPADKPSEFARHGRASRLPPSRLPGPETSEALSMPADNRLRLDDHQDLPPTRPQPRQDDPEKAIGHPKRWPGSFPI